MIIYERKKALCLNFKNKVDANPQLVVREGEDGSIIVDVDGHQATLPVFTAEDANKVLVVNDDGSALEWGENEERTIKSIDLDCDSDFVLSAKITYMDGSSVEGKTVDLPLESVVVDGEYDATTKSIILTLQNGNKVTIPVADLVSGLQKEITEDNKLDANLVDGVSTEVQSAITAATADKADKSYVDTEIARVEDEIPDPLWTAGEGKDSIAQIIVDEATGLTNHADGENSVALGFGTRAEGKQSFTSGFQTRVFAEKRSGKSVPGKEGNNAVASGCNTQTCGDYSDVSGSDTYAQNQTEFARGRFNASRSDSDNFGSSGNTIASIGVGTSQDTPEVKNRKNALEVMQNGDIYFLGVGEYTGTNDATEFANAKTVQDVIKETATNLSDLDSKVDTAVATVADALANKQDKLSAGKGFIINNNEITYDEAEIPSVDYVDASISDTMNFIIQERDNEKAGREAGDKLLQNSKVDKELDGTNGKAIIFNEKDGGGAKFVHNDGTESFVGVNDGGEDGMVAQIYADKAIDGGWVGSRVNVYHKGIFYVSKDAQEAGSAKDAADREIAVKGDIPAIFSHMPTADGTYTLKLVIEGGVPTLKWVTAE